MAEKDGVARSLPEGVKYRRAAVVSSAAPPAGAGMSVVYVVGAGGIGCTVGYALLRNGSQQVVYVESNVRKVEWGRRNGVRVVGHEPWPVEFVHSDDWRPR